MRYAIIDGNNVVNIIEYQDDPGSPPPGFPDNIIAVQSDTAGPGWIYDGVGFSAPAAPKPTPEQNSTQANVLLLASDWSVLPDVKLANKAEWINYRAALRAIRLNPTTSPDWPTIPQAQWE